ncbi:MAG: hypothetical protein ABIN89_08660 [Chitinophagaceae bacterium]
MRYLLFVNLLFSLACVSPYKGLQNASVDITCVEKFKPVFTSALYNTQVNVIGKHLSGLLLIKMMPDSSIRMVFSNEMGFTFFDFEFSATGNFKVYSIIKQMNKKAVIKMLRKDFELILMRQIDTIKVIVKKNDRHNYFIFPQGKEFNYYITDLKCDQLVRIEKTSKRKIKVQVIMQNYVKGIPDTIGISHRNFNFNIGLKRLQR